MFKRMIKLGVVIGAALMVASCTNNVGRGKDGSVSTQNILQKEKLYQSSNDYRALVSLYRDYLKNKEDSTIRYKLAENYYLLGDSKSSSIYLAPVLQTSSGKLENEVYLLQIRNYIQLKQYDEAIKLADVQLKKNPKDGSIYNLRGIAYAQIGNLSQAYNDLMSARENFISDNVAINNLSMLNILNGEYGNAVNLLLPQYLNGQREPRMIYNLVFALVKSGDLDYAKDIITKERLNSSPDDLINALQKTERTAQTVKR